MRGRVPRLLVDVTNTLLASSVTGIQRVTLELVRRFAARSADPDPAFELALLRERAVTADGQAIGYARLPLGATLSALQTPAARRHDVALVPSAHLALDELGPDAVFLDLDASWHDRVRRAQLYPELARHGVAILAVHYDSIPLHLPEYVHPDTAARFVPHLEAQVRHADRLLAISRRVRDDLLAAAAERGWPAPAIDVIHLGADFAPGPDGDRGAPALPSALADGRPFVLAVGTLEPRKNHAVLLDAFDRLSAELDDLRLVLVGRSGWLVEELVDRLRRHPLLDQRLFWLEDVPDATLRELYRAATLSVVPSRYEGYGLPVIESLAAGVVTLASDRGALPEAGAGLADHFDPDSIDELAELLRRYLTDAAALAARRAEVAGFTPPRWDDTAASFERAVVELAAIGRSRATAPRTIVYLSIHPDQLRATLAYVEHRMPWLDEAIVVTPAALAERLFYPGRLPLSVLTDEEVLGEDLELFQGADHQGKNWLLRRGLVRHPRVPEVFVMSDDDYRPLRPIAPSFFIRGGRHQAYYFHDLGDWPTRAKPPTAYDHGLRNADALLTRHGEAPGKAFSSHCPQVIDKAIYGEMVERFGDEARRLPVDEWSIYFNHALRRHPERFEARVFRTLCWPARPTDWEGRYQPDGFDFENYYPELYRPGQPFADLPDDYAADDDRASLEKVTRRLRLQADYDRNRELRDASLRRAGSTGPALGQARLVAGTLELELGRLPATLEAHADACTKLMLEVNVLAAAAGRTVELRHEIFDLDRNWLGTSPYPVSLTELVAAGEGEPVEVPLISPSSCGRFRVTFHLRVDGRDAPPAGDAASHLELHVVA